MEVTLAFLCDSANVTAEGKLNVLGQFDMISAPSFPTTRPLMHLVLRLKAAKDDVGREQTLTVRLVSEDSDIIGEISGRVSVRIADPDGVSDESPPLILETANMSFEQPGNYAFHVLIDTDRKTIVPLYVVESPPDQEVGHGSS